MLDTLTLVLIALGLGLTLLTGLVVVGAFCITALSYTIWVERTGGLQMIAPTLVRKPKKKDEKPPEGFQGYKYWTDPNTGRQSLLPIADVEALEAAIREEDEQDELDLAEIDKWVEGKAETNGEWRGR